MNGIRSQVFTGPYKIAPVRKTTHMISSFTNSVEHERSLNQVASSKGIVDVNSSARHVEENVVTPNGSLEE